MIYVGIDVASDKHDVAILGSDGKELCNVFTIQNNRLGFDTLISTIAQFSSKKDFQDVKIGLESTGHYHKAISHFVCEKRLSVTVLNPLAVNRMQKATTLRRTKTDKSDAKFLAIVLMTDDSKPVMTIIPQIDELKTLTRHRFRLVKECSKHKQHLSRLITIVFPELTGFFSSTSLATVRVLLDKFPNAKAIANAHITKLTNLLWNSSKHRFGREKAEKLRDLARSSVGTNNRGTDLEIRGHLQMIDILKEQIKIAEAEIKTIMLEIDSTIISIPGIGFTLGAMIIAEIGNIKSFSNPAKLLAFAGLEPSLYQSGKFVANNTPMVKHGSKYLRYAFVQAAASVARHNSVFEEYANKKLAQNKHYYVVMGHVAKKLVRVSFYLLRNNLKFNLSKTT